MDQDDKKHLFCMHLRIRTFTTVSINNTMTTLILLPVLPDYQILFKF